MSRKHLSIKTYKHRQMQHTKYLTKMLIPVCANCGKPIYDQQNAGGKAVKISDVENKNREIVGKVTISVPLCKNCIEEAHG